MGTNVPGTTSNMSINMLFPDSKSSLFERKKSSVEKNIVERSRRSSSKNIEPHRLVKVSKPLNANSLLNKNM